MKNLVNNILSFCNTKKFFYFVVAFMLSINLYIIVDGFAHKNQYQVDEQWSYAHANSNGKPYIAGEKTMYQWLDSKVYHDYLTVQRSDGFNYTHIYENLKNDMHTPLYFMILYTISYFFPDTFSPWIGGGLNIVLWIMTLVVMYRLSQKFLKNRWMALAPVILYSFSLIGISTAVYIRLYTMQTLLATCLINELLLYIEKQNTRYRFNALKIFIFSLLGMLTSYNSLVLSFVLSVVFGTYLLIKKEYRKILYLALAMVGSVIFFIYIFPYAIIALIKCNPYYYKQYNDLTDMVRGVTDIYVSELLNIHINVHAHKIYVCISFICFLYILTIYAYCVQFSISEKLVLLLVATLIVNLYLFYAMPEMYEFRDRYTMLLYPTISVLSVYVIYKICLSILSERKAILCVYMLIFLSVLNANYQRYSAYLMRFNEEEVNLLSDFKNKNIVVTSPLYIFFEAGSYIYINAHKMYFLPQDFYNYFFECQLDEKNTSKFYKDFESIYQNINKGDYLFAVNKYDSRLKYNFVNYSITQRPLCPNIKGLKYLKTLRLAANLYFDIYQIIHIEDDFLNGEK